MDTAGIRFLLEYLFIFKFCRLPLALFFERFGVQFMSRRGMRSRPGEVERSARRQVRIRMDRDEQHVGIAAKILAEGADEIDRGRSIINGKRAANSQYAGALSSVCRDLSGHSDLEGGNRLP